MADEVPFLQVIPALGRTSFRIIFLPAEEGSIESSLFINTSSHGILSYHVSDFLLWPFTGLVDLMKALGCEKEKSFGSAATWFVSPDRRA